MEKTEIIAGDWMFKHIDPLNWRLLERREIGDSNKPNGIKRAGQVDWVELPNYYGTLKPAILKAKELNRERNMPTGDLDAAIAAIERADDKFLKELKKALKAVGKC